VAKRIKSDTAEAGKVTRAKARAKSTSSKSRKSPASKKVTTEKRASSARPFGKAVFNPTDDQISMRAYFISERRRRFDLPGDANSDWLEAKRQLLTETRH